MGWSLKNLLKTETVRKSSSLHCISLLEQAPSECRGVLPSGVCLSTVLQPGSLGPRSSSSSPGRGLQTGPGLDSNIAARSNLRVCSHLRHRSMPAIHLHDSSTQSSVLASQGMMANPPVFDNPLRRRGCCNHDHAEQLQEYRQEAIQRELRAKRTTVTVDDIQV